MELFVLPLWLIAWMWRQVGDSQKPLFVTLAQRSRSTRPEQPPVQPPPLQPPPQPPRGMVHPTVSIGVTPIPVPGIMAPNMAYFPPSAPLPASTSTLSPGIQGRVQPGGRRVWDGGNACIMMVTP